MARRRQPGPVLVAAATLLAIVLAVGASRVPVRADVPTLTRLRITIESSSDWARFELPDGQIQAAHVVSAPAPAEVTTAPSALTLRGLPSAKAVVDVVVHVAADATPVLRLRKGMIGTATASVTRTVDGDFAVGQLDNRGTSPTWNSVEMTVTRDALVGPGLTVPKVDDRKLVLAFYYPWFTADRFRGGIWVDSPAGPFATDDPAAVAAMVDQAAGAGINGFLVEADGPAHLPHYDMVLAAAAARPGFQVAPYLDIAAFTEKTLLGSTVDESALTATGKAVVARAAHGSYLHVDGKPVIGVFGMWGLTADRWARVRTAMESVAGPLFVVGDRADPAFGADGFHYYNPNSRTADDLATSNRSAANSMRLPPLVDPNAKLRLWAATVSPGENNLALDPLHPVYRDRAGGARYDSTWRAAVQSDPDWVLVTTWNEWLEATHIQPGASTGTTALSQTGTWARQWRG